MSYTINKTDGTVLTTIIDGTIDQVRTDLTLIGKSASAYGEYINENLVHLLENFANTSQPSNPISGQLWYDTLEGRLKVYDEYAGFKLTSGTIVSKIIPSSIAQGDIWIDTARQQLYFNDGVSTILAGPLDPAITGFKIVQVSDTAGTSHNVLVLTVGLTPLAIFSTVEFKPDSEGLLYTASDTIKVGLNFFNSSFIRNVSDPIDLTDAVNKNTLQKTLKLATLSLTVDIAVSGITGSDTEKHTVIIDQFINKIYPASSYTVLNVEGPICRVICNDNTSLDKPVTIKEFILRGGEWEYNRDL
jgi:hypothetical protein